MPEPTYEIARELLAKGDFEKAFAILRPAVPAAMQDDLLTLEGSFNGVKEAHLVRGLAFEKYQETTNGIRYSLFDLLQRIENQIPKSSSSNPRHFTKVPHPGYVVGRDGFLKKLHHALTEEGDAALVQGLGGIGKTTVALAYAHHPEYAAAYDHIIYVEISGALCDAFTAHPELTTRLGAEAEVQARLTQNDPDGACRALLDAIGRLPGRKLLVLDNANDREEMRHWKRELGRAGSRLLVTSRADIPNLSHLPVEELEPEDAGALFAHHYGDVAETDRENLATLLDLVERHTLLTEMLGKIGRQARYAVAELRDYLKEGFVRSPHLQRRVDTGALTELKGLDEATLMGLTRFLFEGVAPGLDARERDYLRWMAVLPPRTFAADLLARLFQVPDAERPAWEAAMDDLEKKGVPLRRGRDYGLHRLMREVILETEACTAENCEPLIKAVTDLLEVDHTKDNPVDKFPWIDFGEALMTVFEQVESSKISELKDSLARLIEDFGDYERAKVLCESALESDLKNFGPEHPTVAVSQSNLANVYRNLGQYDKARDLLEAALESAVKNFGQEHPNVAVSQSNLANVYRELGQYDKARDLLEAALESDVKNFGQEHPNVAVSQSNLANVYSDLGQYDKARDLLEAALESAVKNFGQEHPNVATRQNNLAFALKGLGLDGEAVEMMQKAYALRLKLLGPDHPYTKQSAKTLRDWGAEPAA